MKAAHVLAACAIAGLASAAVAGEVAAEVSLQQAVALSKPQVLLGDVATVRGTDLEVVRRLVFLPLGQLPASGLAQLTRETIERWAAQQMGPAAARVSWGGADRVSIAMQSTVVQGLELERVARRSLEDWLALGTSRSHVEVVDLPPDLTVPAGTVEVRARPLPARQPASGRQTVWVDLAVDGRHARAVPVTFMVQAFRDEWVTRSAVARGASLQPGELERNEVPISPQSAPSPALSAAAPLRALRNLPAGSVVGQGDTEVVAPVTRGEQVTVVASGTGVLLESQGEALQDGRLGQTVRVRARGATEPVMARVVGKARVEVNP
jgi:flagella basal body P-ring formation protein FlgA